jgi:hypothetical protein
MTNKGGSGKLPKKDRSDPPSLSEITGRITDTTDPKNEILSILVEGSRSLDTDQNAESPSNTVPRVHSQDPVIGISAAHLQAMISESVAQGLRSVNERVSSLADRLEGLENASKSHMNRRSEATFGPDDTVENTRADADNSADLIDVSEEPNARDSSIKTQIVHPHEFITSEPLGSRMEKDISDAFYYALIVVPEDFPEMVPRDILQETLALEQRGEFASIPQSFVFRALQILRELDIHVCKRFPSARSNLFHLLTGQSCECAGNPVPVASAEKTDPDVLLTSHGKILSQPPSDNDSSSSSSSSSSTSHRSEYPSGGSSSDSEKNQGHPYRPLQRNRSHKNLKIV